MNTVYPVVVEGEKQPNFVQAQPAGTPNTPVTAVPPAYNYQPAQPVSAQPMQPMPVQSQPVPVTVVPPVQGQMAPVSPYYPTVNNIPQNTLPEINDDLRRLFKLYPMLIVTVIIDWFAGTGVGLFLIVFLILGSVYLCTYNYVLLVFYLVHRYISIVCGVILMLDEMSVLHIVLLVINILLTIYVTNYFAVATKVKRVYNANQIQYLKRMQCRVSFKQSIN